MEFLYNNIKFNLLYYERYFNIDENEINNYIYNFYSDNDDCCISYVYPDKNSIMYIIYYNEYIEMKKLNYPFNRTILCNLEDLKIFSLTEWYEHTKIHEDNRNDNNEIISFKKYYNKDKLKEEFISNNNNPPFSKTFKNFCIELINHCNKNINNNIEIIKTLFEKEKVIRHNLLLNYNLEMIDFK